MGKNVYKYHQLSYILSCCIFFRHNLIADYDNTIILSTCCIVWIHTWLWYISAHIQSYTYTSVFQRVLLDSKGWCIGTPYHPFSTLWKIQAFLYTHWPFLTHFFWCFFFPAVSPSRGGPEPWNPPRSRGETNGETSQGSGLMIRWWYIYI